MDKNEKEIKIENIHVVYDKNINSPAIVRCNGTTIDMTLIKMRLDTAIGVTNNTSPYVVIDVKETLRNYNLEGVISEFKKAMYEYTSFFGLFYDKIYVQKVNRENLIEFFKEFGIGVDIYVV